MSKVYEIITERIIQALEQGQVPWKKPWLTNQNLVTRKPYRGINALITGCQNYSKPYWCTYKQATSLGGQVKKGSKSTPIVYWNISEKINDKGVEVKQAFPLYSNVFNIDQIDGLDLNKLDLSTIDKPFNPIESCLKIVSSYKNSPKIEHVSQSAHYVPSLDIVNMPKPESFISADKYYSTLFHELGHSTGHSTRLNREGVTQPIKFKSHNYSKEELIAEMTAAFLCSFSGIDTPDMIDDSASYIKSWLSVLKADSKILMASASQAQKASDLIMGIEYKMESETITE